MSAARAAALILCGLVGAVALAGCGDDEEVSSEDYVSEAQAVATSFSKSVTELSAQIDQLAGSFNLKNAAGLLQTFSDRVDDLAAKIDDIDPPAAVEDLHTRLVDILENFASKAQQAAIALKAGDLLGGLPALTGFAAEATDVVGRVDRTVNDIQAKLGID